MKALTIRQPWASLIALGVKTIETRSWRAPQALIGQTIAIHAGKSWRGLTDEPTGSEGGWLYVEIDGVYQAGICVRTSDEGTRGDTFLTKADGSSPLPAVPNDALPLGAIVATATLADCVPIMWWLDNAHPHDLAHISVDGQNANYWRWGTEGDAECVTDQLPYGDFAPGRWAWLLTDVQPTTKRCPACMGTGGIGELQPCRICGRPEIGRYTPGTGMCQPIPAKGRQGVWTWQP